LIVTLISGKKYGFVSAISKLKSSGGTENVFLITVVFVFCCSRDLGV